MINSYSQYDSLWDNGDTLFSIGDLLVGDEEDDMVKPSYVVVLNNEGDAYVLHYLNAPNDNRQVLQKWFIHRYYRKAA
jgi:hypothetical protein